MDPLTEMANSGPAMIPLTQASGLWPYTEEALENSQAFASVTDALQHSWWLAAVSGHEAVKTTMIRRPQETENLGAIKVIRQALMGGGEIKLDDNLTSIIVIIIISCLMTRHVTSSFSSSSKSTDRAALLAKFSKNVRVS